MNKDCVFTIVAKNYIGLGEILGKTLHKHNPEVDFRIFVADEFDESIELPDNVIIARNVLTYTPEEWRDMTFKYDLTEFCTSIKPAAFRLLFNQGYERVIYFDPDIYVFSSIDEILSHLRCKYCVLTPQVDGVHMRYAGEHPEWLMNTNGICNLGFGAFSKSDKTLAIMDWWTERLRDQAFNERSLGQFTDQKWMDWMQGFIDTDHLHIMRNLGMNLAPWNFFERKIEKGDDGYFYVSFRAEDSGEQRHDRLVFVHYSGYDYNLLKQGIVRHKRIDLNHYKDLEEAINSYGQAIKAEAATFDQFIDRSYSYGHFDNGDAITIFHRRLYHGLPLEQRATINPFATGNGTFHDQLRRNGLIDATAGISVGKKDIKDMAGKKRMLNRLFKMLFKLMGYKRYVPFTRSLYFYVMPEEHTFLIDHKKIIK